MVIGMGIGVLVEALLSGGGTVAGGRPPPKDKKGMKEWLRNKLKALARLLGRLGVKVIEALPGIIRAIISWILNRVKGVVGWVLRNLCALVISVGGLLYTEDNVSIMETTFSFPSTTTLLLLQPCSK